MGNYKRAFTWKKISHKAERALTITSIVGGVVLVSAATLIVLPELAAGAAIAAGVEAGTAMAGAAAASTAAAAAETATVTAAGVGVETAIAAEGSAAVGEVGGGLFGTASRQMIGSALMKGSTQVAGTSMAAKGALITMEDTLDKKPHHRVEKLVESELQQRLNQELEKRELEQDREEIIRLRKQLETTSKQFPTPQYSPEWKIPVNTTDQYTPPYSPDAPAPYTAPPSIPTYAPPQDSMPAHIPRNSN
jgi:hypothetical protein